MTRPLLSLWPVAWRVFFPSALLLALTFWLAIPSDIPAAALGLLLLSQLVFLLLVCWAWRRRLRLAWHVRLFRTRAGRRVVLHYEASLEGRWDFAVVERSCEAALDDLAGRFGFPLRGRLVVFLFATWKDVSKVFGEGYAGTALSEVNAVVLAADTKVSEVFGHELTHLFAARWNPQAPPLLGEGLATWLPGTRWGWPVDRLARPLLGGPRPVLPELLRRQVFFSPAHRHVCYVLAASFTGFLIRRFGWDRYRTLYRKTNPAHRTVTLKPVPGPVRFAATFQKVFGLTLEEAERQWREELKAGEAGRNGRQGKEGV